MSLEGLPREELEWLERRALRGAAMLLGLMVIFLALAVVSLFWPGVGHPVIWVFGLVASFAALLPVSMRYVRVRRALE